MRQLIFLGPTIEQAEARAILPEAIYLPPVRQSELISAIQRYEPTAIGIIDGYFLQDLAVWHKEILYALKQGIAVFGSSSMGALRAAEMKQFGMRGIGRVYEWFASGTLTDDDEVALAHAPEEMGYAKLSEPMVNIRATLRAAQLHGLIAGSEHDVAVAAAKALYFPERNAARMEIAWREAGMGEMAASGLASFFRSNYVDVKREDAVLLLRAMAEEVAGVSAQPAEAVGAVQSIAFDTLRYRDRKTQAATADFPEGIEQAKVYRFAAIHCKEFENDRFHGLNRMATVLLADQLGLTATEEEGVEQARRFRARAGMREEESFREWLRRNDWEEAEFLALMREIATCGKVHRWWLAVAGNAGLRVKLVLDEMRLAGSYEGAARLAAQLEQDTSETRMPDPEGWTAREAGALLSGHARGTGFRLDVPVEQWAREVGYFSVADLLGDVHRSVERRQRIAEPG
jgi:hypothetical protein